MHFLSFPLMQWIVKRSGAESLIEISNWLVGWSRMVPPCFDKQTYNQDCVYVIGQKRKTIYIKLQDRLPLQNSLKNPKI